jgi:hypothetical protein
VNLPKLTILTADIDAACDPETGTCTIPQTPIPSPGAAPLTATVAPPGSADRAARAGLPVGPKTCATWPDAPFGPRVWAHARLALAGREVG